MRVFVCAHRYISIVVMLTYIRYVRAGLNMLLSYEHVSVVLFPSIYAGHSGGYIYSIFVQKPKSHKTLCTLSSFSIVHYYAYTPRGRGLPARVYGSTTIAQVGAHSRKV